MSRATQRGSAIGQFANVSPPALESRALKPRRPEVGNESKQTVKVPRAMMKAVKQICLQRNLSFQQITLRALEEWLVREGEASLEELQQLNPSKD